MYYVGIDIHKKYSVCATEDEQGRRLRGARIAGNSAAAFAQYLSSLGGPCKVALEACWNWATIYDRLVGLPQVEEVVVAHPLKTRLIGEAQIKTDKIDAQALSTLLRGNFIARVHVPPKRVRQRKDQLRQRLYFARLRTAVRNRIHALLDRQEKLELPQCSDLFGARGLGHLRRLELAEPDGTLLRQDLALLEVLNGQIKEQEREIARQHLGEANIELVASVPGLGLILAPVIASEIDEITRFADPEHLCAYAGLVPTTHGSGGQIYHGKLLWSANKWLRWAFIEGAWVAIGCSGYFGALYKHHRARGKKANTAITIVARRMCQIVWHLLQEKRAYLPHSPLTRAGATETFPGRSALGLTVPS
jgi:transposase